MTVDILTDIRAAVDKAIADGIAFEDFRANLEPILRAKGWWGLQEMTDPLTGETRDVQLGSNRRLGIIYDMNLRTSYSEGRWNQIQQVKDRRPYLRYQDPDPNPRPEHLAWSGLVVPADGAWASAHYPPNGWNCKCYMDSVSQDEAGAEGYEISEPQIETETYVNPRTGAVSQVPEGVNPAFAYPPGAADADIAKAVEAIRAPTTEQLNDQAWGAPDVASAYKRRRGKLPRRSPLRKLNPVQFENIHRYSGFHGSEYNSPVRREGTLSPRGAALLDALEVLPPYEGTVYRGERWSRAHADARFPASGAVVVLDAGFMSTSQDLAQARKFASGGEVRCVLTIRSRTGRKIWPIALEPREREVLFPPSRRFRISNKQYKQAANGKLYLYVSLEEEPGTSGR